MGRTGRLQTSLFVLLGFALLGSAALVGACGSDSNHRDAGSDRPETGSEVGSEHPADVPSETGGDVPGDMASDMAGDMASDMASDVPKGDAGDGGVMDAGSDADGGKPDVPPPTMLTATILDRRQTSVDLTWPAPATGAGGTVSGYDIRVAKVPITAANFDDTTVTLAVTYTGTPAAPGQGDGMVVKNLNVETPYYFAVAGKDSGGTRSAMMTTATAVMAALQTVMLTGNGTDGIGQDIDGSGDFGTASTLGFAADGFSDLIVGAVGGTHVYIYFGTATGYATTPSITITGTTANFGQAIVNAGDLDGDGLADIAIASPNDGGGGRVFIFSRKNPPASWGTTNAWPAALTQAQANYVLTADATYAGGAGSIQPMGMARLGNFDGTGTDDLAIGFALHNSQAGGVLIVKGRAAFASLTIPDAGGQTIQIDGAGAGGFFGATSAGIGPFFATPAGPGLVTSAFGISAVYAYPGQSPTATLTAAGAADSLVAPVADSYGSNFGFLGAIGGSAGAVTIGGISGKPAYVDVHLGTAATGPFLGPAGGAPAPSVHLTDAQSGNSFGIVNIGGAVRGTSQVVSFIGGDAVPDLVVAGQGEAGNPLYVVNGAGLVTMTGTVDVSAAQAAVVAKIVKKQGWQPSAWGGYAGMSVIPDVNKDGYGDFAVGEYGFGKAGRVVVFY